MMRTFPGFERGEERMFLLCYIISRFMQKTKGKRGKQDEISEFCLTPRGFDLAGAVQVRPRRRSVDNAAPALGKTCLNSFFTQFWC